MKNKNEKASLATKNVLYGFGGKFIILVLGIIIPRIIIVSYGSELNGFLSTITQIFTYFALLEAGIGNSAVNALFSPLEKGDIKRTNAVVSQARSYYRKATLIYCGVVVAFAFVYPFIMPSGLSKWLMIAVILLQGAPHAISYYFCAVYEQLLMADGKRYVSENVQLALHILTSLSKIILVSMGFDIIAVQLAFFLLSLIKIPVVMIYCKKKYPYLSFSERCEENLLHERSAFVIHEVSSTIFSNTDVFVISVFCGFEAASIYTVYNMIFASLNSLVNTANNGLGFILGRNLERPIESLRRIFDVYSTLYTFVVFVIMTTASVLSIPFVTLYTSGIEDVNYVVASVPVLFGLISVMSGARAISARLISVSGHARRTLNRSLIEMFINIISSVILVNFFDIYGVLLGTVIALIYRMNDIIIYANRKILKRSPKKTYTILIAYFAIYFAAVFLFGKIGWNIDSYAVFMLYGVICVAVFAAVYFIPTFIVEREGLISLFRYLRRKK